MNNFSKLNPLFLFKDYNYFYSCLLVEKLKISYNYKKFEYTGGY